MDQSGGDAGTQSQSQGQLAENSNAAPFAATGSSHSIASGRLSYALYLWHFPVQVLCSDYKEDIQRAT